MTTDARIALIEKLTQRMADLKAEGTEHLEAFVWPHVIGHLDGPDPECPACDDIFGTASLLQESLEQLAAQAQEIATLKAAITDAANDRLRLVLDNQAAEQRLAAILTEANGLVAKWRERADGPTPTDRAIGYEECADGLAVTLARYAPPAPRSSEPPA